MRDKRALLVLALVSILVLAGASGCEQPPCEACAGENPCPENLVGGYIGTLTSQADDCTSFDLNDGSAYFEVMQLVNDVDNEVTTVNVKYRNVFGSEAIYSGRLCAAEEKNYPKSFTIDVAYTSSDAVHNLTGILVVEAEGVQPTAVVTIIVTFFDESGALECSLTGTIIS